MYGDNNTTARLPASQVKGIDERWHRVSVGAAKKFFVRPCSVYVHVCCFAAFALRELHSLCGCIDYSPTIRLIVFGETVIKGQ